MGHPARMKKASPRVRASLAKLLVVAVLAAPLASGRPPATLTEPAVRTFMAEVAAAAQSRDVARIGALLAPDCSVTFVGDDPTQPPLGALNKDQYLARLTEGYAALNSLKSYEYTASNLKVQLNADRTQAIVDTDVAEHLTFADHDIATHSHEASVIEMRNGKPSLVRVTGTVSGTTH